MHISMLASFPAATERLREVPLKRFIISLAESEGRRVDATYQRYYRGHYPGLKLRRVNKRVVFVVNDQALPHGGAERTHE